MAKPDVDPNLIQNENDTKQKDFQQKNNNLLNKIYKINNKKRVILIQNF